MSAYVEVWFGDHVFSADAVTIPNETAEVTYKVERWIGGRAGDAEEAADSAVVERDDFLAMLEVIKTASERPAPPSTAEEYAADLPGWARDWAAGVNEP